MQARRRWMAGAALVLAASLGGTAQACSFNPVTVLTSGNVADARFKERLQLHDARKHQRREAAAAVRAGQVDYAPAIARTMVPAVQEMDEGNCGIAPYAEPDPAGSISLRGISRQLIKLIGESPDGILPEDLPIRQQSEAASFLRNCNDEFRAAVAEDLRGAVDRATLGRVWQVLRGEGFDLLDADTRNPAERLPRVLQFASGRSGKLVFNRSARPGVWSAWPDIAWTFRNRQTKLLSAKVASDPDFAVVIAALDAAVARRQALASGPMSQCPRTLAEMQPILAEFRQELDRIVERGARQGKIVTITSD